MVAACWPVMYTQPPAPAQLSDTVVLSIVDSITSSLPSQMAPPLPVPTAATASV